MAQKIFNKRTLAILLSLAMLLNGFQVSAMAAGNDTAPEMVQNFEDTYYKQDGTVTTANDWQVHLSKTAAVTDQENVFDITLKVETKDVSIQLNDGAAVLVLDISSSMAKDAGVCGNCDKAQSHSDHRGTHRVCTYKAVTHLDLLKKAVKSFLDSYVAEAEAGDKRLVAIVKFATNADTVLSWIDVNNEANMATVKNAVDAMGSTNGTNIEAGMVLGRNLLKLPAVSNIPLSNQSLILFSDGSPTVAVGNVNDNSVTKVNSDNRGISSGSSRTSDDLDDILAAVSAKKKAVAYNTDAALLKSVFGTENVIVSTADTLAKDLAAEAGEIVTTKTNASAVIDPMAAGVTMLTVSNQYNTETETWDLSQFAPAVENGITTYTITYRVKLDSKVIAADSNYPGYTVLTPANGATILTYTVGNSEEPVRADFNEPNIRGIIYYTVSYAYVGEVPTGAPAVPGSATYRAGESVTVAANPALENYTFSGWDRADFVMPAANVVIHGQWFENLKYEYTVIYNENNGTDPETKNDSENITDTYENPYEIGVDENTFERENYTFIGWSTEKDGPVDYQPGDEIVFTESGTVELFAQWIENKKYDYSLIYNANFGSNEIKVDAENISGTYATSHNIVVDGNTFVRPNYTFAGWNTEADGSGISYAAGSVVALDTQNPNEILYAQWIEDPKYSYGVIYNSNNGKNESKSDIENVENTYANPYEIGVDTNTFVYANHIFLGWALTPNGPVAYQAGDEIPFAESGIINLYAKWQELPKYAYNLTYNANFGANQTKSDSENISGIYETTYSITVDGNTFVRPNFTFVGWNTEADGSGKSYTVGDKVQLTAQNNTEVLYAQWIENPKYDYSVIYNANFGTDEVKEDAENVKRIYNTTYKIYTDSNTFTRANYTFVGWNTERDGSGKSYTAGEVIALTAQNNTEVLYAQWIENPKYDYSVTYDANFGANQTKSDSENVQGIYQTAYNIKVDRNTFVRVNYTFVGWNTERDGSGKSYTADQTIALTAQDNTKVLYAQWKENPKYDYTLIYNANFDQNETKADAENITAIYAATYSMTVDVNSFRRPNYTFVGWNTEADGSGRSYAPGEKIQLTARNNIEVLYAQWAENPKYNYSVTYDANFGTNETKADAENVVGVYTSAYKISVDANTFVRVNYTFVGWNTERDGSGTAYPVAGAVSLTAQKNTKILYAQWIENDKYDYSVFYNANFGEAPEVKADAENVTGTYKTAYDIGVDENTFVRPNYTFIGWSDSADGEVAYAAGDNIHFVEGGSITLYALWAEHDKYSYTVIYNGNGGTLEDGKLAYGDSENVADTYATAHNIIVDANTFAYANHTFIGWNSKADGTGTSFTAEDVIALTTEDNIRTLYAQWKENPKYDYCVSYDANFGEASEVLADAENVTGIYKDTYSITVDENSFLRTGYTFVGWNTERDGSGTAYAADEAIALTAENNTEILYAQWEINSYEYTVNYFVRVEGEVYAPFAGDLSDAPAGEAVLFGTVIDKDYLVAKGLPASLADAYHTYNFTAFEGVIVMEEENVVNVYYTAVAVEPPVEEIPDDEVPLSDIPKTGDPIFVYAGMAAVSGIGLICLGGKKKSEEETEE